MIYILFPVPDRPIVTHAAQTSTIRAGCCSETGGGALPCLY
ncbi:MAG: hypothetical protein ACOYI9_01075 [Candidatus Hydrogenedentales bacterium]